MNGFLLEEKGENYKSEKENGRGGKAYIQAFYRQIYKILCIQAIYIDCNLCISAGFYDEEDNIVDFRIINYILKIKTINKEVYIY